MGILEPPSPALPGAFCGRGWQGAAGVSLALAASHTQVAIGGSGAEALRESGQTCFPKERVGRCDKEGAKPGSGPRVSLEHAGTGVKCNLFSFMIISLPWCNEATLVRSLRYTLLGGGAEKCHGRGGGPGWRK